MYKFHPTEHISWTYQNKNFKEKETSTKLTRPWINTDVRRLKKKSTTVKKQRKPKRKDIIFAKTNIAGNTENAWMLL